MTEVTLSKIWSAPVRGTMMSHEEKVVMNADEIDHIEIMPDIMPDGVTAFTNLRVHGEDGVLFETKNNVSDTLKTIEHVGCPSAHFVVVNGFESISDDVSHFGWGRSDAPTQIVPASDFIL